MVVGVAIHIESNLCPRWTELRKSAGEQCNIWPGYPREQCNTWPGYPRDQCNTWPGYPRDQCNTWPGYPRDQCNTWPGYPREQCNNTWPGYVRELGCIPEHAWRSLIHHNKDHITHYTTGVYRTTLLAL